MAEPTPPRRDRPRREGIAGWLIFFLLCFGVIGPVLRVSVAWHTLYVHPAVARIYGDNWPAIQALVWSVASAGVAIAWYLCWRLVRVRRWRTVRVVVAGLWLLVLGLPLLRLVGTRILSRGSLAEMGTVNAFPALETLFFCATWTAYLLVSRRVAEAYPRHGVEDVSERFA